MTLPEQLAALFVTNQQWCSDGVLDYSMDSLKALENDLDLYRREGNTPSDLTYMLLSIGCYFGEVMRRNLGGQWINLDDSEQWTLDMGEELKVFPLSKPAKYLENGEEDSLFGMAVTISHLRDSDVLDDLFDNGVGRNETKQVLELISDRQRNAPLVERMKIGRNDLCPCGSGRKFKKCCMNRN